MGLFDTNWTPITAAGPAPTTGTAVTGHVNGVPVAGTMQGGIFSPNT